MPIHVDLPDGAVAEFPDGMEPSEIQGVLTRHFKPPEVAEPAPKKASYYTGLISGMAGMDLPPGTSEELSQMQMKPGYGSKPIFDIMQPRPGYEEAIRETGTPEDKRLLGYQKGVAEMINSLMTPDNLDIMMATAGAGTAVQIIPKLVGLAFSAVMGKNASKDIAEELGKEYALPPEQRDQEKIGRLISSGVAQTALSSTIGAKSLSPTTPKGIPDASEISKTTEVHGDVQSQPIEGSREMPIEASSPGIQPQAEAGQEARPLLLEPAPEAPAPAPAEQVVPETKAGTLPEAKDAATELGFTLNDTPQSGGIKFEGLTPEQKAQLPAQWEFTDKRADSPTKGMTFYVPEGASKADILKAADAKKAEFQQIVDAPKSAARVEPAPVGERPLGIVAPSTPTSIATDAAMFSPIESLGRGAQMWWREYSMQSAPRFTKADRVTGEKATRYAAAPGVARLKGLFFAERVLEKVKEGDFDRKFGAALTEDNLRSIRDGFTKTGDTAAAGKVASLIGAENSPFKTEAEYQAFLNDPRTVDAINRHKQLWDAEKDPIFRQATDLDPDAPLESRGLQTGARINLKNVLEGEGTKTTVGPAGKSSLIRQTATILRKDPFARKAKGTGQSYESSYREIMANGYEREYPVATQHDFINSLTESGNGVITETEFPKDFKIKGEPTKAYLMRLRPWSGKFLQIPKSFAKEYEAISGLSPAHRIPYYTRAGQFFTNQSIKGLAEFSTHAANILTDMFLGVGPTGSPLLNGLLKAGFRADILVKIPGLIVRSLGDQRGEMLKLAEINAAKNPYGGTMGWILNKIDQGARLNAAAIYKRFVESGIFPDTETGLREFVNQTGNYNRKLQTAWIRLLRDTNVQPFATAHRTFMARGLREMVLDPGTKANSKAMAIALRAEKAAGIIGTIAVVTALNYLVSKSASGPPGTNLGSVGWIGDDGKLHQFSVVKLMGMDRGFRQLGISQAVEAKRLGLPVGSQLKAGVSGAGGTAVQGISGPLNQFIVKSATGYRPGVPMVPEAKVVAPQDPNNQNILKTQLAQNIKTALQQANPLIDAIVSKAEGKPLDEILQKQFSRYTPRTGQSPETIKALPKIVHSGEIKTYAESLSKEARKLPLSQRRKYVRQRFKDDEVRTKDKEKIMQEISRRGVFHYK